MCYLLKWIKFSVKTRMHSSRMRTGCSLTVSDGGENLETPRKFGDPPQIWRLPGTRPPTPLSTESQTPVKTLPWPNFVAAGKNKTLKKYWKNGKKYWKSQGILSVRKSGNPVSANYATYLHQL